ncbi:MAG: FliI/YscN family ATPase [Planctomycetota bacterium]
MSKTAFAVRPPELPKIDTLHGILDTAVTLGIWGRVRSVSGDNITVQGMTAPIGSICQLLPPNAEPVLARVIGFHETYPILAPLESVPRLAAGDPVRLRSEHLQLRVSDSLCGRVIDALGRPIDGRPMPTDVLPMRKQDNAPESMQRPPIDTSLQTGVRAVDGLLTCGIGQRMGIFAGSGVGKSTLLGMLTRGTNADRIVIAMVGERGREVQEFLQRALGELGLKRSVVVVATSDRPAAQRLTAAWTATSIAESFRDQGHDVLLLVDSVTRFAMAQREVGLASGEPPTTRGYPPSVFNELPRLVERAGRTDRGSITAFYTVLVEGDDNNEPIADALRGLLDGHVVLSRKLAVSGHYPPIDVTQSLSRLQPHLVAPDVATAAVTMRETIATYERNEDLISIGAYRPGSDVRVDTAIALREPINEFLRQHAGEVVPASAAIERLKQIGAAALAARSQPQAGQVPNQPPPSTDATATPNAASIPTEAKAGSIA